MRTAPLSYLEMDIDVREDIAPDNDDLYHHPIRGQLAPLEVRYRWITVIASRYEVA